MVSNTFNDEGKVVDDNLLNEFKRIVWLSK